MTSILRIEKPNNCHDCPLCYDDLYCCANDNIRMSADYDKEINPDCPLEDEQ